MKYVSADEAVKCIKSGDSVFFQGSTSVPELIQEALAKRAPELRGVQIFSGFNITSKPAAFTADPAYRESFLINSIFPSPDIRKWINDGWGTMVPVFLSEAPGLFRRGELPMDVAVINCSLPDENGYCSYGVSADLAVAAVECASRVIAQVNKSVPYLYGGCLIHESKISAAVLCDEPCVDMKLGQPTAIEAAIGLPVPGHSLIPHIRRPAPDPAITVQSLIDYHRFLCFRMLREGNHLILVPFEVTITSQGDRSHSFFIGWQDINFLYLTPVYQKIAETDGFLFSSIFMQAILCWKNVRHTRECVPLVIRKAD